MSSKNPFDLFGISENLVFYWESKLIKNDIKSFSFSAIREHQTANLLKIKEIVKNTLLESFVFPCVSLGIWIPRKPIELFLFDIEYITNLQKMSKNSLVKKDLIKLIEQNKSIKIVNQKFDIRTIKEKIIYK